MGVSKLGLHRVEAVPQSVATGALGHDCLFCAIPALLRRLGAAVGLLQLLPKR